VCLSGSLDDLNLQLDPVGPTRESAQTGILKFTMESFVYKMVVIGFNNNKCLLFNKHASNRI